MKVTKDKDARTVAVEFEEQETKILKNDLLDELEYFAIAAREKLANCKSRLLGEWVTKLINEKYVPALPTDETELLDTIFKHPAYKNRADREKDILVITTLGKNP